MRYPSAEGAALFRPTCLRIVKLMYFDSPQDQAPIQVGVDLKLLIRANGLAMVLMTPWIGSLMTLRQTAIKNTFLIQIKEAPIELLTRPANSAHCFHLLPPGVYTGKGLG